MLFIIVIYLQTKVNQSLFSTIKKNNNNKTLHKHQTLPNKILKLKQIINEWSSRVVLHFYMYIL